MKKVICMLLALLMMLAVFAGCAKQSETQTTDTPAQTDTQTPAETTDEPAPAEDTTDQPASEDPITLTFWTPTWRQAAEEAIIADFEAKYPNIKIEATYLSSADIKTNTKIAASSNTLPDMWYNWGGAFADYYAENGLCLDLTDYANEHNWSDRFLAGALQQATYDGKIIGLPQNLIALVVFYRKDLLEAAGVSAAPKSWAELYDVCAKLKGSLNAAQYPLGMPTGQALGWATWGMQYNTTGGLVLDDTWTQVRIEEPGYRELAELFYNLYKNGYAPAQQLTAKGYNDIIDALCQDKLAMTIAGSWSVAEIMNNYPTMADKIGVAPIPTIDGDQSGVTATNGGWTYAIDSGSQHQKESARVIEWMFCEDAARTAGFFEAAHYSKTPVNKSVQEYIAANAKDVNTEWLQVVTAVSNTAKPEPLFSWDVTVAVMKLFDTVSTYATTSDFDTLYDKAVEACLSDIASVQARAPLGENPRLGGTQ